LKDFILKTLVVIFSDPNYKAALLIANVGINMLDKIYGFIFGKESELILFGICL